MKHNLKKQDRRKKVFVVADSHGKGMSEILSHELSDRFFVRGFVKPGAKMEEVLNSCNSALNDMTDKDYIVVIGGSNDASVNKASKAIKSLSVALDKINSGNVLVIDLPHRHDLLPSSCLNFEIEKTNGKMEKLTKVHSNTKIIHTKEIERKFFTRHGQHLNKRGKIELGKLIVQAIFEGRKREVTQVIPLEEGCIEPRSDITSSDVILKSKVTAHEPKDNSSELRASGRLKKLPEALAHESNDDDGNESRASGRLDKKPEVLAHGSNSVHGNESRASGRLKKKPAHLDDFLE